MPSGRALVAFNTLTAFEAVPGGLAPVLYEYTDFKIRLASNQLLGLNDEAL